MADFTTWLTGNIHSIWLVILTTVIIFATLTGLMRLAGLRSLSKMSSTDFVTTIAIGSLMASVISAPSPSIVIGIFALICLFLIKSVGAVARCRSKTLSYIIDNKPLYLMRGDTIIHDALKKATISEAELNAKLREANVWSYSQVITVVLETTGDISVVHRDGGDAQVDSAIFADVSSS
ncbi:MAG: DUF421 domain-containing protein [Alphaproteobacteria bacterium]|nr:DUF421 domain-containing protein [Alphaproteobacteria bacterium]